jgi:hypothetical protein
MARPVRFPVRPMKRKKKKEILVEHDQVIVVRNLQGRERAWCVECGGRVQMVSVDEAAAIAHTTSRAIYRSVDSGKTHFAETPDGRLLICLTSLLNSI